MSHATDRWGMVRSVPGWSLFGVPRLAKMLGCSHEVAHRMLDDGEIPWLMVGKRKKVDPLHVAIYILAGQENITPVEYWSRYSEDDLLENVERFYRRARRIADVG